MIKVYLMVGMLCIPSIECFNFMEPNPKQYTSLQECLADGKKVGEQTHDTGGKEFQINAAERWVMKAGNQQDGTWIPLSINASTRSLRPVTVARPHRSVMTAT